MRRRIGIARRRCIRTTTFRPRSSISSAIVSESPQAALKQAQEREALVVAGPRVEQVNAASRAGGAGARRA